MVQIRKLQLINKFNLRKKVDHQLYQHNNQWMLIPLSLNRQKLNKIVVPTRISNLLRNQVIK